MDYCERVRREMFGDAVYERMLKAGEFDAVSVAAPEERAVRDEFARESQIDFQLKMLGAGQAFPRPMYAGLLDDSMDLLTARSLAAEAEALWTRAPDDVKKAFPSYSDFMAATRDGRLNDFILAKEKSNAEA